MKQYKKIIAAVAAAAILALPLSGCSFNDVMLYLYGGDSFTKEEGEDYQTYDGENGISVTYDANIWNEPSLLPVVMPMVSSCDMLGSFQILAS